MELIRVDEQCKKLVFKSEVVACIGEFDGMHIAHQELVKETIKIASGKGFKSAIITFDPHPDYVLNKREYEGYLISLNLKKKIAKELGLDYFVIINFNESVLRLSKEDFYNNYLKSLKALVVGSDYKFGYKGEGDITFLNACFEHLKVVDMITDKKQSFKIGSDIIRNALKNGDVELANELLGRYFSYCGIVIEGKKIGRTWGFPTANIIIGKELFKIKKGVYAVKCEIENNIYFGIANFGNNPTCNFIEEARLEVNLFDFNSNIYGKKINVNFIKFIREEIKFESSESLKNQIKKDIESVKKEFGGKV